MKKYGVIIEDYDIERLGKTKTLLVIFVGLIKKFTLVGSIMVLEDYPTFIFFGFVYQTLFFAIFLIEMKPFDNSETNLTSVLNEIILLVVTYHLFGFTNWVDTHQNIIFGNSVVTIVAM
jgi:hypothetical protein